VIGYLLVLAMGTVAWYAWPAAPTFPTKVWTVVFAVFLAPFSWPWLIARGYRHRRWSKWLDTLGTSAVEGFTAGMKSGMLRQENIAWWRNEMADAERRGDAEARQLAADVLLAMGEPLNPTRPETS
jgi:hypothetical protein